MRSGVPASSTSLGLVAALDHLGVRAAVLDELAGGLGTPVLTANQVTFWHALRLAGQPPPATGLGVLSARKGR